MSAHSEVVVGQLRTLVVAAILGLNAIANAAEPSSAFTRPELLVVTWTPNSDQPFNGPFVNAWRPDDTPIPPDELNWLRDSRKLKTFYSKPDTTHRLHPLVLVYKIDARARRPQRLKATLLVDGKRISVTGGAAQSTPDHLATTSLSPRRTELAEWPAEITVEIVTPVEDPVVMHTLDAAKVKTFKQDTPLQVAKGVTWQIVPPNERTNGRPASVLSIDREQADAEYEWYTEITLNNRPPTIRSSSTLRDGSIAEELIMLDDPGLITRVDLSRVRHRVEKYEHVPTHPELIPK
jgi:hypothetical protein